MLIDSFIEAMELKGWIDVARIPMHYDTYNVRKFLLTNPNVFDFLFTYGGIQNIKNDKRLIIETIGSQKCVLFNPEWDKRKKHNLHQPFRKKLINCDTDTATTHLVVPKTH